MHPAAAPLSLALVLLPVAAAAQDVYGNKIPPKDVSPAVEECEYQMLVEDQTCNTRMNKSECIKEIHRFCVENYSDLPYPGTDPGNSRDDRNEGDEPEDEP